MPTLGGSGFLKLRLLGIGLQRLELRNDDGDCQNLPTT